MEVELRALYVLYRLHCGLAPNVSVNCHLYNVGQATKPNGQLTRLQRLAKTVLGRGSQLGDLEIVAQMTHYQTDRRTVVSPRGTPKIGIKRQMQQYILLELYYITATCKSTTLRQWYLKRLLYSPKCVIVLSTIHDFCMCHSLASVLSDPLQYIYNLRKSVLLNALDRSHILQVIWTVLPIP